MSDAMKRFVAAKRHLKAAKAAFERLDRAEQLLRAQYEAMSEAEQAHFSQNCLGTDGTEIMTMGGIQDAIRGA